MSLNDLLLVGPVQQSELFDILIGFQIHRIAFSADIEKMYRQILIAPEDRNFQRIVLRSHAAEILNEFTLNTVTYGRCICLFFSD